MAPIANVHAIGTNALQQRITSLDRSQDTFSLQLEEAYSLLGIDSRKVAQESPHHFSPKEEWVLRWLLKRFDQEIVQDNSPCLEPDAWVLLRLLVACLPTKVVARLLTTHKFTAVLGRTLEWLYIHGYSIESTVLQAQEGVVAEAVLSRESSSSATVLEIPIIPTKKTNKRKRDGMKYGADISRSSASIHATTLYLNICGALNRIMIHTNVSSVGVERFAAEHMKAALRVPVSQCAEILGCSLGIIVIASKTESLENQAIETDKYTALLKPLLNMWSLRSIATEDSSDSTSAQAFSTHCLVRALQLWVKLKALFGQDVGMRTIARMLEELISTHIILPARASFLHLKRSEHEEKSVSLVEELLSPLQKAISDDLVKTSITAENGRYMDTVPPFLDLAINLLPRVTPKQRSIEAPWLQNLFVKLSECLGLRFPISRSISPFHEVVNILEKMLRLFLDSKIILDTATLASILFHLSGIDQAEGHHGARWTLVKLCMNMDPNLVVTTSLKPASNASRLSPSSNIILDVILAKISSSGYRDGNVDSTDYDVILHSALLPLLECFIHARNMLGFNDLWKQQITEWQSLKASRCLAGTCSDQAISIWEDDVLLHTVGKHFKSSLTSGQICRVLQSVVDVMGQSGVTEVSIEQDTRVGCELVILDSVIDGIKSKLPPDMSKQLQIITEILTLVLINWKGPYGHIRWRLWRILTTIESRWPMLKKNAKDTIEGKLLLRALDELRSSLSRISQEIVPATQYIAALSAFGYLVATSQIHAERSLSPAQDSFQPVEAIVASLAEQVEKIAHKESGPLWNTTRRTVDTLDTFILACTARIVVTPSVLSILPPLVRSKFFEQLYSCAAQQEYSKSSAASLINADNVVTYAVLWEDILRTRVLDENQIIRDAVCQVLVRNFLAVDVETVAPLDLENPAIKLAISGLCSIPAKALKWDQKHQIILTICSRLIENPMLQNQHATYMAFLIHCMQHAKRTMLPLSEPVFLWNLASIIDSASENNTTVESIIAFRQLTSKILEFVIQACKEFRDMSFLDQLLDLTLLQNIARDDKQFSFASTELVRIILGTLWSKQDAISQLLHNRGESLGALCHKELEWLAKQLISPENQVQNWQLGLLLENVNGYLDLIDAFPVLAEQDTQRTIFRIKQSLESGIAPIINVLQEDQIHWKVSSTSETGTWYSREDNLVLAKTVAANLMPENDDRIAFWLQLCDTATVVLTARAMQAWLRFFDQIFAKLRPARQTDTLNILLGSDTIYRNRLCLLSILGHSYERHPDLKSALALLFFKLTEGLEKPTDGPCWIVEMHCLDLVMRKNPFAVSQWHIDSLLSMICILVSGQGPFVTIDSDKADGSLVQVDSPEIFTCLCRLLGTVLAHHRSKLGGRYHLVVLALQGLLRCLFDPYTSISNTKTIYTKPPWLRNTHLTSTDASLYARLVTAICDPTVSAVTRSRNRAHQELNDETKKARSVAGQHLQYVLMEFCQCQLHGRIDPEVRNALNPGLYALFGAMSPDVLRTINAALDPAGRAIFKVTFEDYRRFGRWHET